MTDEELNNRGMARLRDQDNEPLSDERTLGRLEGLQMQIEYNLYRLDHFGPARTREILESELRSTDMLVEFQREQMSKEPAKTTPDQAQ